MPAALTSHQHLAVADGWNGDVVHFKRFANLYQSNSFHDNLSIVGLYHYSCFRYHIYPHC